jgi:hypothetical protein
LFAQAWCQQEFEPESRHFKVDCPQTFASDRDLQIVASNKEDQTMPQGDKSKYTGKQKRQAEHIEEGYEDRGVSTKEAERRAWATVNKESGGGKKSGSGRGKKANKSSSRKGGKKAGKKK